MGSGVVTLRAAEQWGCAGCAVKGWWSGGGDGRGGGGGGGGVRRECWRCGAVVGCGDGDGGIVVVGGGGGGADGGGGGGGGGDGSRGGEGRRQCCQKRCSRPGSVLQGLLLPAEAPGVEVWEGSAAEGVGLRDRALELFIHDP